MVMLRLVRRLSCVLTMDAKVRSAEHRRQVCVQEQANACVGFASRERHAVCKSSRCSDVTHLSCVVVGVWPMVSMRACLHSKLWVAASSDKHACSTSTCSIDGAQRARARSVRKEPCHGRSAPIACVVVPD